MFYGWWIVILMFLTSTFGGATIWYGFTAYFNPLIDEFGWSYTAVSLAASLRGAEMGLMDIIIGFLLDRFGSRRVILASSVLIGIGFIMASQINSLTTFYISFIIIFIGATGIANVVLFSLIGHWFRKRLGLTLGIASTGYGVGGFALPGIVYLLDIMGFRTAFFVFGISALVIGSFATYFLRNQPEDMGYGPDGAPLGKPEHTSENASIRATSPVTPARDYTFKEAISTPAFWIITYAGTAAIFSGTMILTHVMPYLEHIGYARYTASIVAMMIPAMSIAGRLGTGGLSDFISHKAILLMVVVAQIAGILLFTYASISFLLIPFVVLFGISYGGIIVLRPAALREYYGSTNIGSIIGLCVGLSTAGGIGGPLLAGWIFDTTGNYETAWIVSCALLLASVPLALIMKRPQAKRK